MSSFLRRIYKLFALILFMHFGWSSVSWADPNYPIAPGIPTPPINPLFIRLPVDLQEMVFNEASLEYLLNLSVAELDRVAREDKNLRRIILSENFYQTSKRVWFERGNYKNLVDFPQYLVLREIQSKFKDFEWRMKAVHMLLDAETQFAEIPAGTFQMGSPNSDHHRNFYELQHWVRLSSPTWLQRVEFTQLLLFLVTGNNHSRFSQKFNCLEDHLVLLVDQVLGKRVSLCPRHPAEWISARYVGEKDETDQAKSNTIIGILRDQFGILTRLPTEAEWERAARGTSPVYQSYSFGELSQDKSNLKEHAWYQENSNGQSHRVATKKPNFYGLFDLHGNAWEMTSDFYADYPAAPDPNQPLMDPQNNQKGRFVARGGSWGSDEAELRSAIRDYYYREVQHYKLGFRLVRILTQTSQSHQIP